MKYQPKPLNTTDVTLPNEIYELREKLAENIHEVWSAKRIAEGWTYGKERNDHKKQHPDLVPYEELTEEEKEYDRATALETLKTIIVLGYRIEKEKS